MFASIRRHQNWIWLVVVAVVIVSFVIFFSPTSRMSGRGGGDNSYDFGTLNGKKITREDYASAIREVRLYHFLRTGEFPSTSDESTRQEAYNRILMIQKMADAKIAVSPDEIAQWIANLFGRGGAFNATVYQNFVDRQLRPNQFTSDDFERFVRHEIGRAQLISVFGESGRLVTPKDIELRFRRENEGLLTEAVVFEPSNYLAQVAVKPDAVAAYYTNHLADFRVPDRVSVNFVRFDLTNHLAEADTELNKTNLDQALEARYQQLGTNYFKDAAGKILSPDAAKAQIKEEERRSIARNAARKQAYEFLGELLGKDSNVKHKAQDLAVLATAKGLKTEVTAPFDASKGPTELKVPNSFDQLAFSLTPEEPIGGSAIAAEDGVYVVGFNNRLLSEMPTFESIKDKVTEQYKLDEARTLAIQAGQKFGEAASNGVMQAKSFDAIAKEQKLDAMVLPSFSLSTRTLPELSKSINFNQLQNVAARLPVGHSTGFIATMDGGMVVYLKSKVPVDEARLKSELPAFAEQLRENWQIQAFSEWFQHQASILSIPNQAKAK